jgi:hypothetical protein
MLGLSPEAYVLRTVSSVRANDLEQALLLLPFADALKLLQWVAAWLAQGNQVGALCSSFPIFLSSPPFHLLARARKFTLENKMLLHISAANLVTTMMHTRKTIHHHACG